MNVLYLSTNSFFQVDKEILPGIAKRNQVHYHILMQQASANYSYEEINTFLTDHNIEYTPYFLKYRQRDVRSLLLFFRLIKDLRASKSDLFYIVCFDHPVFSVLSYFLKKRKVITALHDANFHSDFPNLKFHKLARDITLSYFNEFLVYSKQQAVWFKEQYPQKHVFTIPLPLSDYQDNKSQNIPVKQYDIIKFLFFGTILHYKGLDILIKAFKELEKKYKNVELTIAGKCEGWDDIYKPLLENSRQIGAVIGYVENATIDLLFKESHYLVLPYREATQSGPLMIAYNYNVPVITSNIDAFENTVVNNVTGYMFEVNDSSSLASTLEYTALKNINDYYDLQVRQKQYVEDNFAIDAIIGEYQKMFQSVINEGY